MTAPLTTDQLRASAAKLPRVPLAHLPTPLEETTRFAKKLGGPRVFIKRDDCTGMVMGGNKTRHNEFLFGEALKQKADCLVWGAGVQSNNCRQTAAACNKLGLDCYLYLSRAAHNDDIQGNLLLDHILGAKVTIIDQPLGPELDDMLLAKAKELQDAGRRPFVWNRVTGRPIAAVSYALCLAELLDQAHALGVEPTHVYAAAAGATGAGTVDESPVNTADNTDMTYSTSETGQRDGEILRTESDAGDAGTLGARTLALILSGGLAVVLGATAVALKRRQGGG
jgi:D-cysteine desulfhydrase/L-cysteate sulfo-lyase